MVTGGAGTAMSGGTDVVRFAMCGVGYIARIHARAIAETAGAELVAVHNHRPEALAAFTADHPVSLATTDFDRLLDAARAGRIDVAVIGTPNVLHAPQAIALLEAGAHVLIEKPMTTSVADALEVVETARRVGRHALTAHMWRFDPDARWLRAEVEGGSIGRIVRSRAFGVHTWWGPAGWFTQKALAGGGALADMGVHAIDTTRYLIGDPAPTRVYARLGTSYGDYDVDDTGIVIVEWQDGTVSEILSGWWQVWSEGPEAATRLFGRTGFGSLFPTLVAWEGPDEVVEQRSPPPFERPEHCAPEDYAAQIAHVRDVVRGTVEPRIGPDVGLTVVRIMEAAYRSAETGQPVELG